MHENNKGKICETPQSYNPIKFHAHSIGANIDSSQTLLFFIEKPLCKLR